MQVCVSPEEEFKLNLQLLLHIYNQLWYHDPISYHLLTTALLLEAKTFPNPTFPPA